MGILVIAESMARSEMQRVRLLKEARARLPGDALRIRPLRLGQERVIADFGATLDNFPTSYFDLRRKN